MTVDSYSYWPTAADASTSGAAVGGFWPMASDTTGDPSATASTKSNFWKEASGAGFHDLLDAINPLQHLPVIGTVYRWATGDEPGNVARVIGDGIYGGPIGLATGMFNAVTRDGDGEDLGEQVMAWAFGPGHSRTAPDQGTSAVAAATPTGTTAPAAITATKLADLTPAPAAAPADASPMAASPAAGSTRSLASVAALYRSTDPAAQRAAAPAIAAADAGAMPDHPLLPLERSVAAVPGAGSAAANAADDPAHQLSAQNAMLQRQISVGRSTQAPGAPQLVNNPIPLQLTGQTLPGVRPRPAVAAPQQATASQAAPGPTAPEQTKTAQAPAATTVTPPAGVPATAIQMAAGRTKIPDTPAAPTDLAVGTPAEISQKMMTALDKYTRLQQQERATPAVAGSQIDVSP